MPKPRILIGTPTYDGKEYCFDYWAQNLKKIVKNARKKFHVDVLIVDNSQGMRYKKLIQKKGFNVIKIRRVKDPLESLANARKKIFNACVNGKYDYLFSLEQDIVPPPTILRQLYALRQKIKKEKAIIGAPYILHDAVEIRSHSPIRKDYVTSISSHRFWRKEFKYYVQSLVFASKLPKKRSMKCFSVCLGCTLIDSKIIESIKVKFVPGIRKPDDSYFFIECQNKKIPVYSANLLLPFIRHYKGSTYHQESWLKHLYNGQQEAR
ncbi:MAG: hypothetical protein Q8P05_02315 [Candidatus Diapherotrites archaeon]|nr:hypothetical protein [Candidatus Diapherotrites archaeon]